MSPELREQVPLYLAGAAAATTVVSIAAFEALLGLALLSLLVTRAQWRWPPVTPPFCLWVAGGLGLAFAFGVGGARFPQIKKVFIYASLFLVFPPCPNGVHSRVVWWGGGPGGA